MRGYRRIAVLLLAGALVLAGCGSATSTPAQSADAAGTVPHWESIPKEETDTGADTGESTVEEETPGTAGTAETEGAAATEETSTEETAEAGETGEPVSPDPAAAADPGASAEGAAASTESGAAEPEQAESAGTEETEAAEETTASADTAATEEAQTAPVSYAITGTAGDALKERVRAFMQENGLDASNFSVSYLNLGTGETLYFNELTIMTPASTYKLPLNMYYYDMQARGEISGEDIVQGTSLTLNECHYKSLVESDNPTSEAMLADVSFSAFRQYLTRYFTLTDSEIGDTYWHRNFYCTRMMMDTAAYLYRHASDYTECIGYLKQAQPGLYFRRYITGVDIAQKYGKLNGYENCVGIVYGSTPFALCIYSYGKSEDLVARLAEVFYNSTEGIS